MLDDWQEHDIIRPVYGEVIYDRELERYVRRFQVAGLVVARKNGKSELAAGTVHLLLVGDDEEAAEVYGAAKDTKQAGKVADVVERMRQLSEVLRARLKFNKANRRVYDERTSSYYEVITSDALGELGANPHGFVLDEVLSQPDATLWEALRTGAGARTQPLFWLITTETNDPASFGAEMIDELERVAYDPKRNPRWFAYVRKLPNTDQELERLRRAYPKHPDLPVSCDPWDERNWKWPNPALDSFLARSSLRQEAMEAKLAPTRENSFRQYRLNQRMQQITRFLQLDVWDRCGKETLDHLAADLDGLSCYVGLDLAATTDMAAAALLFPGDDEKLRVLMRYWVPEAMVSTLDKHTGGRMSVWVKQGLVRATEGDWIDLDTIERDLDAALSTFTCTKLGYDPWGATSVIQHLQAADLTCEPVPQTYAALSNPMNELLRLVRSNGIEHAGDPVLRWHADCIEARSPKDQPDVLRPVKPNRQASTKRIDGIVAILNGLAVQMKDAEPQDLAANVW